MATALLLGASLTGCSGSSGGSAQASPTAAAVVVVPSPSVSVLDPEVPLTQKYATTVFDPPLTIRLPAGWLPTERDASAFQVYAGDEDYEITLDHTYRKKETVTAAIERLKNTEGIEAGSVTAVTMGGRQGLAFMASRKGPLQLRFTDSGFHVPGNSELEVMAVPLADGATVTVFVTRRVDDGVTRPLEPMRRLARRILAAVTWR